MRRAWIPPSGSEADLAKARLPDRIAKPPARDLPPELPALPDPAPPPARGATAPAPYPLRTLYANVTNIGTTTLLSVPPEHTARIHAVQISNVNTADVAVQFLVGGAVKAAGYLLFYGGQLTRYFLHVPIWARPGDSVQISLSVAGDVEVAVDYDVLPGVL